ncbi:MAG TPA: TIGR03086 family metal-binding protein [Acidimicrobiales bacterium]|nr:TIGR03086 family metal-binding protein [Acidimicrobiales bacterium]
MDPLTAHERAQKAFASVLAGIGPDRFGDPTPCARWTVRDVAEHIIGGNFRVAGVTDPPADDDLAALHGASAAQAQATFAAPDGLTRDYVLPFGSLPGSVFIGLRTTDVLTHAWDLAKATGQPTDLDSELAEELLAASRERIDPSFRGEGRPFGEEQPCASTRPAADRLAAFLGRRTD